MTKQGFVYILSNKPNGTIYVGVTSNLIKRIWEHKEKLVEGFTKKYDLTKLVYYEIYDQVTDAIIREKQLKAGNRNSKVKLINDFNPRWNDLYDEIIG